MTLGMVYGAMGQAEEVALNRNVSLLSKTEITAL